MSQPPANSAAIRVLLIDDSAIIRLGLKAALEGHAGIEIVAEAGSASEGLAVATAVRPDVVLLDLRLPDHPGFWACREIVRAVPTTRVLILTSSDQERDVQQAVTMGAVGYLLKDNDGETLAAAIRQVASGRSVLDPALAARVLAVVRRGPTPTAAEKIANLTPQERRIVGLLTAGQTNKEIGDALGLTEKTVKNYLGVIFSKLNITRRAQAAALFTEASANSEGTNRAIRP